MNALDVKHIGKKYKGFTMEDVSFSVEPGTIMGLIGANGAGKTTLIRLIMNMIKRDGGEIFVYGKDNINEEIAVKNEIGYVSEDDFLFINSNLTQYEKLFRGMYAEWDNTLFRKFLKDFELPENKKFGAFSKGMKVKAMLALALSHKPKLLVMDEPTAGLDPAVRLEVLDLLREFVADGEHAVLFSTHITSDLDKVADYITLVIGGRVIESMSVVEVEEKYAVVTGENEKISEYSKYLIGTKKGHGTFEALILRKDAVHFANCPIHSPNLENLLTFTIWDSKQFHGQKEE